MIFYKMINKQIAKLSIILIVISAPAFLFIKNISETYVMEFIYIAPSWCGDSGYSPQLLATIMRSQNHIHNIDAFYTPLNTNDAMMVKIISPDSQAAFIASHDIRLAIDKLVHDRLKNYKYEKHKNVSLRCSETTPSIVFNKTEHPKVTYNLKIVAASLAVLLVAIFVALISIKKSI